MTDNVGLIYFTADGEIISSVSSEPAALIILCVENVKNFTRQKKLQIACLKPHSFILHKNFDKVVNIF